MSAKTKISNHPLLTIKPQIKCNDQQKLGQNSLSHFLRRKNLLTYKSLKCLYSVVRPVPLTVLCKYHTDVASTRNLFLEQTKS